MHSNTQFLLSAAKPQIISLNTVSMVILKQATAIFCSVMSKSAAHFTWHFNGNVLQVGGRTTVETDTVRMTSTVLIRQITYAEAGNYTCMATNIAGTTSQVAAITVQGK